MEFNQLEGLGTPSAGGQEDEINLEIVLAIQVFRTAVTYTVPRSWHIIKKVIVKQHCIKAKFDESRINIYVCIKQARIFRFVNLIIL